MHTEVITARGLTRHFGTFVAVDDVTFSIGAGEIFGFLGPNGAGKTTTIRMLSGILPPSSGSAMVAGMDVESETQALKQRIGYMSQRFSLYSDLRVEENIEFFAGLYGVRGERIELRRNWILDMSGLRAQRRSITGDLALGHRQRLALGCAVLHEPAVLFLDEPTSGVDPVARRAFWDLIRDLAAGGTTVLVSTHYMEEAEYCDRLALMNRGRLIALDSPAALRAGMTAPILEVRAPDPMRLIPLLREAPGIGEAALHGRALRVVLDDDALGRASLAAVLPAGAPAPQLVRPGLEDVFTHLVRREGGAVVD
jgi:ABC-2 type transport system ATP-binding protein